MNEDTFDYVTKISTEHLFFFTLKFELKGTAS